MKEQNDKQACVFGGTGFIGRQIVRALVHQGYQVRVATRTPERAYFLKTCGNVGQIVPVSCNYNDEAAIRGIVKGCDVVVNCTGILYEKGPNLFVKIHIQFPRTLAKACREEKINRFIHLSALSCDQSRSKYGTSKHTGELAITENFPKATILRPSVVFGAEDSFFNLFAKLSVSVPFLPLIGGGTTKFQPIYVGDIARAVVASIDHPESMGKTYELGGPEILTFRQIYEKMFTHTKRPRPLLSLPWCLATLQGMVMGLMPRPLITADQVTSLKVDNVVSEEALTIRDLGIEPTGMDIILPTYLRRHSPGGRFGDKKRA